MGRRGWALAIALLAPLGCHRPPPVTVEPVRFYAAPGLPGELVAELALGFRIARPTLVGTVDEAEVAWLRSPTEAIALGARAVPGSAPEQPRMPSDFTDPKRRFAPVGAIATVIIASAKGGEPYVADDLRELADPRLRGRVALTRLGLGEGPRLVGALELAYGARGTNGWLEKLAANAPILVERDAEVVELVASGAAAVGVVDSLTAGSAAERAGLRIVFTDQNGKGCVVIPTALVVLPGATAPARKFGAWLAGPDTEGVLANRAVGLLPLREEAQAPPGIVPVWKLAHVTLDWSALAEREAAWRPRLAPWPSGQLAPKGHR